MVLRELAGLCFDVQTRQSPGGRSVDYNKIKQDLLM